jgi:hypothetical protein
MAMKDQMELTITICVGSSIVRLPSPQNLTWSEYNMLTLLANRLIRRSSARYRWMAVSICDFVDFNRLLIFAD